MRRLIRTGWFEDSHRFDNLHVLPATMSLFDSKAGDWQLHQIPVGRDGHCGRPAEGKSHQVSLAGQKSHREESWPPRQCHFAGRFATECR